MNPKQNNMKKITHLFLILFLFLFTNSFSQEGSFTISFSGEDAETLNPVIIEQVLVKNLSRDCDTSVYGPDPTLTLSWVSGLNELESKQAFQVGQNYPNPLSGSTRFDIQLTDHQKINIKLINIYGAILVEHTQSLSAGIHSFEVQTSKAGIFHIEVGNGDYTKIIKIVSQSNTPSYEFNINYAGAGSHGNLLKKNHLSNGFVFQPGDELEMTVSATNYPDQVITEFPNEEMQIAVTLPPVPIAEFSVDKSSGLFPIDVIFSNQSMHNPTEWLWDFGDGYTSNIEHPSHTYEAPGLYTVRLTVGNTYGTDQLIKEEFINSKAIDIECDTTSGYAPLLVNFTGLTNLSDITFWSWSYGDGVQGGDGQSTQHIYHNPNSYNTVRLSAGNADTSYHAEKIIHVLTDIAEVNFTADITNGWVEQTVNFTSYTNIDDPTWYQWSFGDGGTSNEENPTHIYTNIGTFKVILQVFTDDGVASETKEDYITIRFCPGAVQDTEGNIYETIGIGERCWMKENLNVGTRLDAEYAGQTDNGIIEKFCFADSEIYCDEYGGLYQWDELNKYQYGNEINQGICPDDWHIANGDDISNLLDSQGVNEVEVVRKLKADYGWLGEGAGNNESGFTALPAGYFGMENEFEFRGYRAYFWANDEDFPYGFSLDYQDDYSTVYYSVLQAFSLRCVKDNTLKE